MAINTSHHRRFINLNDLKFVIEYKKDYWISCGDENCCYDEWYDINIYGVEVNEKYVYDSFECGTFEIEDDNNEISESKIFDKLNTISEVSHWYIEFSPENSTLVEILK